MAASDMQAIKRRIRSVSSTEHITNAMKLVSAGKLRKARAIFESTNENSHYITHTIAEIFHNGQDIPKKYLAGDRELKNKCYIVITSCRGLCGAFNSNVLKEAQKEIDADEGEPVIYTIGTKAKEYFEKRGYKIYGDYLAPPEDISFLETRQLSQPIIDMYDEGKIDEVVLVYTSFISTMEQEVKSVPLLPFEIENDPEIIVHSNYVEYEPSIGAVFNYLVPKYVEMMLHAAVVESATCEHAARRTAMENASDNANDMLDDLSLYYNRARQAAITDELIEVVAGSEAQS